MMGYPKRIGCEQDLKNLVNDFPVEVKADLERIQAHDAANATVNVVVSGSEETKDLVTKTIANPNLIRKQLGIKDAKAVTDMIATATAVLADTDPIEEPIESEVPDGK